MKESIAQAFIVNLILFFFVILVLLLFGSINYSKAYKSKNRIINIIEKYGSFNDEAESEIADNLRKAGYSTLVVTDVANDTKCNDHANGGTVVFPHYDSGDSGVGRRYDYCVIRYDVPYGETTAEYYKVVAYMQFEVPLIGGLLEFPVRGETKLLYDNLENISSSEG